jgi:hypothetical protein
MEDQLIELKYREITRTFCDVFHSVFKAELVAAAATALLGHLRRTFGTL